MATPSDDEERFDCVLKRHPMYNAHKRIRNRDRLFKALYGDEKDVLSMERVLSIPMERRVYIERAHAAGIYDIHDIHEYTKYVVSCSDQNRRVTCVTNPDKLVSHEELLEVQRLAVRHKNHVLVLALNRQHWLRRVELQQHPPDEVLCRLFFALAWMFSVQAWSSMLCVVMVMGSCSNDNRVHPLISIVSPVCMALAIRREELQEMFIIAQRITMRIEHMIYGALRIER